MKPEEIKLLTEIHLSRGLLRLFMNSQEIKMANKLVKSEHLHKGKSDSKGGTTMFFITRKGQIEAGLDYW